MSDYKATDDDLPEIFRVPPKLDTPGGSGGKTDPGAGSASMASTRAVTAVQLHYPEIRLKKEQRRERRIMARHEREGKGLTDPKQFVKLGKKLQMWDWLLGLEQSFPIMREKERQFCTQLLEKFRKYTPYATKWVTRKQYDWLQQISGQYLQVPK